MDTLVIGCGNLLRGDDGVGPVLIRHLWEHDLPDHIRIADGGTAGMDVAFKMRGAEHVILIDACQTGEPAGTLYRVPGNMLENLPPVQEIHSHSFRWDHALAFARWLLKDAYPEKITVYLIEAQDVGVSMDLSDPVYDAMHKLIDMLLDDFREEVHAG